MTGPREAIQTAGAVGLLRSPPMTEKPSDSIENKKFLLGSPDGVVPDVTYVSLGNHQMDMGQ